MGAKGGRVAGWTAWALGVVGLWIARHAGELDPRAVWPDGMGDMLGRAAVATPPALRALGALGAAGAWCWAGRGFVRRLGPRGLDALEATMFGSAIGLGGGATLIAWLGVGGWLTPRAIAAVSIVWCGGALLGRGERPARPESPAGAREEPVWEPALVLALVGVGLGALAALVHAIVPPWQPDALYYQLTLPRMYLEHHGFVALPQEPVVSGYPGLGQMLFAVALAARADDLAALASWVHLPLLMLGTFALVRACAGKQAGLWGAAVVGAVPAAVVVGSAPLVDLIPAFQLTAAALAVLRARETADVRWSALAGCCLGFALAAKYLALPAVAVLVAATGWRRPAAHAGVAVLAIVIVCAPWMIKNARDWGSPVFPLYCPASLGERVRTVVREHQADFAANGSRTPAWRLPLDVTFDSDPNDIQRFQGELGPLVLALAALPLAVGRPRGVQAALGVHALVLCGVWALASRQVRFLLPAVPPLLAAVLPRGRGPNLLGWCVAIGVLGCLGWTVSFLRPGNDLAYAAGRESRESYYRSLSATASLFDAFARLAHEPPGTVAFFWEYRGYLCPRPFLPEHAYRLQEWPREPAALAARLADIGVSHVLINRSIWDEEVANGTPWPYGSTLEALLKMPGMQRVSLAQTPAPHLELWRLPPRSLKRN